PLSAAAPLTPPHPLRPSPFPYTTLFRSGQGFHFYFQVLHGKAHILHDVDDLGDELPLLGGLLVQVQETSKEGKLIAKIIDVLEEDRKSTRLNSSHVSL